jgi:transcription initiation factor TFIIB
MLFIGIPIFHVFMLSSNYAQRDYQNEEEAEHNSDVECSLCNSTLTIFDAEAGEIVCSNCGVVIQDNIESLEKEWRAYTAEALRGKERSGMPTSLAIHDRGLSTYISDSHVDAAGVIISPEQMSKIRRLQKWNKISNFNSRAYTRNLKNAFALLSRIKDKLSLIDAVTEKAAYYYRKALTKKLIKGRSIEAMIVACIYAACRELSILRTLEEIAKAANTDKVFAGKCYRLLLRHLKIQNLPLVDCGNYLSRTANNANVSEKSYRKALEMLSMVKKDPISFGKDPNALAVAVLYAACIREGEKVSQGRMALAGNTSIVSLRKRFADVIKIFS